MKFKLYGQLSEMKRILHLSTSSVTTIGREFYNVTDVLERWTTVKLATVYYAAILSLKYSHLTIPKESLFTLFKVSIEDTKLDYYAYGGQVLPSFDFVMKLAASHRSAVRRSILFLHRFI